MRNYFKDDPCWTKAPRDGECRSCNTEIRQGEKVFYYPLTGSMYCDLGCGQDAAEEFEDLAEIEYGETGALDYFGEEY